MRVAVIGMGVQGVKRAQIAGKDVVVRIDPVSPNADLKDIRDFPIDKFDAALVCTPDAPKYEILKYLLSHSKHVLVEKPLISDSSLLRELKDLVTKKNVVCYTAYNHRFEPCIARAQQIISKGDLGKVLSFSMFYGNGTARLVRESVWRDKHMGVLADLGSHLLDSFEFILGGQRNDFIPFSFYKLENKAYDHVIFGTTQNVPRITLEATLLSWKNSSSIDIICEGGSLHSQSFCKWSESILTKRIRILPSGKPQEFIEKFPQGDPTWQLEYEYFTKLCLSPKSFIEKDIWINETLNSLYHMAQEN